MDSLGHIERMDRFNTKPVSVNQLSARRPASSDGPRAAARASRSLDDVISIFQRSVVHITDCIRAPIAGMRISRALVPFIEKAKEKTSGPIANDRFEALQSAFVCAMGANRRMDEFASEAVRNNIKSLHLSEIKVLQKLFRERENSGSHLDPSLLSAVDDCVREAVIREAKRNLSEVLTRFSKHSAGTFDTEVDLSAMEHNFVEILMLVQPAADATGKDNADCPECDTFESASSIITQEALKPWFNRHSRSQQSRVKTNLWITANDLQLAKSDGRSDRLIHAFCKFATKLLWPKDPRNFNR